MTSCCVQPGTVGPAGYQLISAIRSRDAGKTVEVEFSQPFPDWPTLFSPLLPSHLMKDFPGGLGSGAQLRTFRCPPTVTG